MSARRHLPPPAKRERRPIKPETWHVMTGHMLRERERLPADSPRRRPTLPMLRFLGRKEAGE